MVKRRFLGVGLLVGLALSACTSGQVTAQTKRLFSEPYTGNPIIFESPGRDQRLQIERVMDELAIGPGKVVADIGAGGGWFAVRAAKRVQPTGQVYAVEISQNFINAINERAKREGLSNIRTVRGTAADPKLPDKSVDAVLILKAYHEIADPVSVLRKTRQAMKSGALLGIIDKNGRGDDHGLNREVVIKEANQAGFKLVKSFDFVKPDDEDYFLVFSPTL
ncbi:MAG: class I SAM-dependent methyltransferase [Anaerolineae bacterium]|nr:class I SAM-dependent methyltransferase [Gloeobacterales cyanobacterium ES-bin-313]